MSKETVLKIVGVVGIVGGSVAMYLSGTGESVTTAIVAGVFVLAGVIAGIFGIKK